ncbi:hypothetical protein [uncultured Mobiluncus sp.]|uniref:hypothetical protein n=1 Tax=uncultured Mobiluncus sp. TaxID=293425 RepID=UPI0028899D66|nr:hypothetical protein [uncultured Mobiluncus sp.]
MRSLLTFLSVSLLATGTFYLLPPEAQATQEIVSSDSSRVVLMNNSTGLSAPIELKTTRVIQRETLPNTEYRSYSSESKIEVTAQDLLSVGAITPKQFQQLSNGTGVSLMSTGSETKTEYPLTATVGLDYDLRGTGGNKKIRVNRVFGSTSYSYPTDIYQRALVAGQGAWGHVLKKNNAPSPFSYTTGWGWYDAIPGKLGAHAILDVTFSPSGMAKNTLTVEFYPLGS